MQYKKNIKKKYLVFNSEIYIFYLDICFIIYNNALKDLRRR